MASVREVRTRSVTVVHVEGVDLDLSSTPDTQVFVSESRDRIYVAYGQYHTTENRGGVYTLRLDTFGVCGSFIDTDAIGGIYDLDDDTLIKCADAGRLIYEPKDVAT